MQHKVTVAIAAVVLFSCAGVVGWQARSMAQMREQITALQQQVGNNNTNVLPGIVQAPNLQTQPVNPPISPFGGNSPSNNPQNLLGNQNDPFADFDRLQQEMMDHMQQLMAGGMPNSLFDNDSFGFGSSLSAQQPDVNLSENDEAYVIIIDIPQDSDAEVSASVDGNELNIEGKITVKNASSSNGSSFTSSQSSQFARSMPLPADADPDGLTNVTEENQVVITIPKQA
ncbi:MAG: Hsp20 family protein [Pseudomonadota bacterium]